MLAWMFYFLLVSILFSAAALIAEKSAHLRQAPVRWIWLLAIVASLLVPVLITSVSIHVPATAGSPGAGRVIALRDVTSEHLSPAVWVGAQSHWALHSPNLELWLSRGWLALSSTLLLLLLCSSTNLWWRKRAWAIGSSAGVSFYVAPDLGPAVVGFFRPRIVMPHWLAQLSGPEQAAVIAHEQSHLEAHDPQALALALALIVCAPWNLPLWWQWRRLRYAVEVDCDARVVRSGRDARLYGKTLLSVGQRQSTSITVVAAMSESRSFLERRIMIMLRKPSNSWRHLAMALSCLSLALGATATQVAPPADGAAPDNSAAQGQHVLVQVPAAVLDGYTGFYDYGGSEFVTVARVAQHLTVEFSSDQSAEPVYPQSETRFFFVDNDAQVSFVPDANGKASSMILHQNGGSTPMERIDASQADHLRTARQDKIRAQVPSPMSEGMLRRLIAGISGGTPNLREMNPQLAAAIRADLPKLQLRLADLGPARSFHFLKVNDNAMDVYEITHDRGSSEWAVDVSPAGLLIGLLLPH